MKIKALLFLLLAALLPLAAPRTARAADVSFDYFYDALLPYGEWVEVTGYGFCWRPTGVDRDWTPYADGYWTFTDAGWTWVGYEEFAGIVYHYGRWVSVEGEGWCWVPDYEWGPAWVSWRNSDDYIGWAPLPPRAYWQPEIGISTWVDTVCDIGPAFYSFCRVRDFGAPVLRPVIINRARNVVIIRTTVNITNITYNSYGAVPVIYNGGPSYTVISQRSERPIPALKLVRRTQFDRADFHGGPGRFSPNARTVGNQLMVNAPIVAPPVQREFLKDKVKKTFAADQVASGWAGVKDGKERTELRQRFQRETKGLTPSTAPARAVVAADLKVVPVEGDANAVLPGVSGKGPRDNGDHPRTDRPANEMPPPAHPAVAGPGEPPLTEPRAVVATDREKVRGKKDGATPPPVISGGPLKPFNPPPSDNPPTPANPPVATVPEPVRATDPRTAGKPKRDNERPQQEPPQNPVVVVPPVAPVVPVAPVAPVVPVVPVVPVAPVIGGVVAEPGQKPKTDAPAGGFHPPGETRRPIAGEGKPAAPAGPPPGIDPAVAQAQAGAEAARKAREQADAERQKLEAEKQRTAQADAEKLRGEQERAARQLHADAEAAALRQKQAAEAAMLAAEKQQGEAKEQQRAAQKEREKSESAQERLAREQQAAAAAALQKQREAQQQAEAAQQLEAQTQARQKQQQEQIAGQRRQMESQLQKAAEEFARQQAAARAREEQAAQQAEQQRTAQEAAKQQATEQRRQQQIEEQKAAQENARQQAEQQHRAQEAERQQAARQQQMEQQRAAQEAAKQQAAEQRRQQQIEEQKAAQENARQQAEQQHRAQEAERQQAARQQAEAQRAAQQQAAQAAQQQATQEQRRGEREKDKEKDKDKGR